MVGGEGSLFLRRRQVLGLLLARVTQMGVTQPKGTWQVQLRRKEPGNPKAVDPEIVEAGKEGPRPRDADVARGGSVDVAGDADMDLEALARELNMDLKEVQEAERMFESAMSAVASLESLSAKFDQMILETSASESAESEDSRKGLRGVLNEGVLENAGLEGLERGMKELVKEIEAASSRVEREGVSQKREGREEVDDDGADVDLAGEAIADMENDLAELQRSVAATLAELDRTATSLTPELGLQEVLKLKSSISADVAQIEQQTGAILGLLREARELQEASQQPGAPVGARQLAAQRAVEARNAMAAMAGSAEDARQPAYMLKWHEVAAERAELKRELAEMFSNAVQQLKRGERSRNLTSTSYLPQWHEVAADRAELKRELAEMFSNAVQLFQEGDEEGAMALVAANEAEVMGQVAAGEAGVEQSAVLLALSQLLLGMGEEAKGRQLMDQALALVASHPSEPLLDDLLENAGDMYYGMEMWDESIKMYKRAVNVQRELAGGEHYLQASTLCSLANALMEAQRHEEAEEVQRRAAELYEAARGERSRGVATMLVRLTQIQMEGGRVEEAEGSILRAKDILIEKEGLTSMEAAIVEFTLAQVRQAQGRPDLAVGVLESGLRIFEQSVEQQRRKGEAGDAAELAGAGAELAWGDDELAGTPRALVNALGASAFPAFEQAQIELSMLYDILDRDEDACAIREKLLSAKELAVGPLSPALVPPLIQLAQSRLTIGQSEGAERLLRRALQIARSAVPAGDARLAVPIERLALCLAQMERFEEAEVLAREHLMIAEGAVEKAGLRGDTVEMLAEAERNLALILMATGGAEAVEAGPTLHTPIPSPHWFPSCLFPPFTPTPAQAQRNNLALVLMVTGRAEAAALAPPPLALTPSHHSLPLLSPSPPMSPPTQRKPSATWRSSSWLQGGQRQRKFAPPPHPSPNPHAPSFLLSLHHLPMLVFLLKPPLPPYPSASPAQPSAHTHGHRAGRGSGAATEEGFSEDGGSSGAHGGCGAGDCWFSGGESAAAGEG
ncbi:unnamed protein product [Closterium sp. Naga37s-1]|nr:unnamed protein product [Closterium sp. Naga37s-1]